MSTKAQYAVRAMVNLNLHSEGKPVSLRDISLRESISLTYLEQLFVKLRRGEIVKSVRGPGEVTCWPDRRKIYRSMKSLTVSKNPWCRCPAWTSKKVVPVMTNASLTTSGTVLASVFDNFSHPSLLPTSPLRPRVNLSIEPPED